MIPDTPTPASKPGRDGHPVLLWFIAACWLASAVSGLWVLWAYENRPGDAATSPSNWPVNARLERAEDRPTLVMLAHPQCSCTNASLGELAEVRARAESRPKTYVVFMKPSSFSDGWEKSGLWETASRLPDTTVLKDDDGVEAKRFGAATSGHTVLYDAGGRLAFSGGITAARGHAGDNDGRASLVARLNRLEPRRSGTQVFGCSLFASGT